MNELLSLKVRTDVGKKVFATFRAVCQQAGSTGYDFGPRLTEIGSKLPKEGLLDAIVHPSAGIGFGYEGWEFKLKDGSTISGILASRTETFIDLKYPGGAWRQIKTSDVKSSTQLKQSLMTKGLYGNISIQDLANLPEYLSGLKKK